jgi:hypothetical protein
MSFWGPGSDHGLTSTDRPLGELEVMHTFDDGPMPTGTRYQGGTDCRTHPCHLFRAIGAGPVRLL